MVSQLAPAYPLRTATRERNRDALLRAAAELALERGYERTSVDAVAQRAGLTKGAVYSIFGSKPGLFMALLTPQFGVFTLSDVGRAGEPLRKVLTAYGKKWAALVSDAQARSAVLMILELLLEGLRTPDIFDDIAGPGRASIARMGEELEQFAAAAGEKLPRPGKELAATMVGSLQGLATMQATGMAEVAPRSYVDVLVGLVP